MNEWFGSSCPYKTDAEAPQSWRHTVVMIFSTRGQYRAPLSPTCRAVIRLYSSAAEMHTHTRHSGTLSLICSHSLQRVLFGRWTSFQGFYVRFHFTLHLIISMTVLVTEKIRLGFNQAVFISKVQDIVIAFVCLCLFWGWRLTRLECGGERVTEVLLKTGC